MPVVPRRVVHLARWTALLGLVAVTGCSAPSLDAPAAASPLRVVTPPAAPSPVASAAAAPDRARASVAVPVRALSKRLRPDVLVMGTSTLAPEELQRLVRLSPAGGALAFRSGTITVGGA